ncbi:hypothetical protein GCM10011532_06550 [Christiangramia forsetii]|nr:hypothetical protein GCM10011532_06550 [Christiangramia forsetii]
MIIILLFLSLFASAQEEPDNFLIEKGTWSLGGAIGFNSSNSEYESYETKNFGFTIRPKAAYFINDNLAAGLLLGYNYNSNKYSQSDNLQESTNNAITIAPSLQKYIGISESFAINLTGSLEYSRIWYENDESENDCLNCIETIRDRYGIALRPGITYLLSDKFSIDANLGALQFTHTDRQEEGINDASTNSLVFSLGLSNIYLGLTFYLN